MISSRGRPAADRPGRARCRSGGEGTGRDTARRRRPGGARRARRLLGLASLSLAAVLLLGVPSAVAGDEAPAEGGERGALLYRIHCSNCHGPEGRGDGPMADVLTVAPADLTRLAVDADGTLPRERIRSAIDGRRTVDGHGRREMPVWGLAFQELGKDSDQEREVQARLDDLVAHLATLQEPREDE